MQTIGDAFDLISLPWPMLIIGCFVGATFSFMTTSYFSDHPTDLLRRSKVFPPGKYRLITFARSEPFILIEWALTIALPTRFRSPRATLSLIWNDGLGGRQMWRYSGFAHRRSAFSIIYLSSSSDKKALAELPGARSPSVTDDNCFVMVGNETENWLVRPCMVSSFDGEGGCFASLGLLRTAELPDTTSSQIATLEPLLKHLDYKELRDKLASMARTPKT